jgi:hypothetical protein
MDNQAVAWTIHNVGGFGIVRVVVTADRVVATLGLGARLHPTLTMTHSLLAP